MSNHLLDHDNQNTRYLSHLNSVPHYVFTIHAHSLFISIICSGCIFVGEREGGHNIDGAANNNADGASDQNSTDITSSRNVVSNNPSDNNELEEIKKYLEQQKREEENDRDLILRELNAERTRNRYLIAGLGLGLGAAGVLLMNPDLQKSLRNSMKEMMKEILISQPAVVARMFVEDGLDTLREGWQGVHAAALGLGIGMHERWQGVHAAADSAVEVAVAVTSGAIVNAADVLKKIPSTVSGKIKDIKDK